MAKTTPQAKAVKKPALSDTLVGLTGAEINALDPEDYAKRLVGDLQRAAPALTRESLDAIESRFGDGTNGSARRAALLALMLPGAKIMKDIREDRETAVAFAVVMDRANNYTNFLEAVIETLKMARARIQIGLCQRDDMESILEEASHG